MTHLEGCADLLCGHCAVEGANERQPGPGGITKGTDSTGGVDDRLPCDAKQRG